jgi:hypothetical protein
MSILGITSIRNLLDQRKLIIDPLNEDLLGSGFYTLTLGRFYSRVVGPAFKPGTESKDVALSADHPSAVERSAEWINPTSIDHICSAWEVFEAVSVGALKRDLGFYDEDYSNLDDDDRVIIVHPGEAIIVHSEEFVGSFNYLPVAIHGIESLSKFLVEVIPYVRHDPCVDRFSLVVKNLNLNQRMLLRVGMGIAVAMFLDVDATQTTVEIKNEDVVSIKDEWYPELLIPYHEEGPNVQE